MTLAVAAALACARREPLAPPPRMDERFSRYPQVEVAAAANPHDHRGSPLCQRCHAPDGRLVDESTALCRQCHRSGHGSHPVDVTQRTAATGLPLLEVGRVACHTCHDPHAARASLRKPFDDLCVSCHRK